AIISSIIPRTSISVARRLLGNPLSSNPPIRLCHSLNQKKNFTTLPPRLPGAKPEEGYTVAVCLPTVRVLFSTKFDFEESELAHHTGG
ncbi:hypothetical protein, partial [Enterobacter asburiae]